MEVKVTFEDLDVETIVEKAVVNEISRLVGIEVRQIFKENGVDYSTLTHVINNAVDKEVSRVVNAKTDKLEDKLNKIIDKAVDKEIEGIVRKKVAKVMSPYLKILEENKKELDKAQSAERETPAENRAKWGIYG